MDLLKDVLGMNVKYGKWEDCKSLPLYMTGNYNYIKAQIDEATCIIMELRTELPTLPALKKQIKRIQDIECIPVVVKVPGMSAFRRKNMIEARIPFIIADKQVYLPFMGTMLQAEGVKNEQEQLPNSFMFSTQQLLLWYFYQDKQKAFIVDAAKSCPFSAMTMTRATRQLSATGLINVKKEGTRKVLVSHCSKKKLYEQIKKYMRSPVMQQGFLNKDSLEPEMVAAGITALSERSMLNGDKLKTYAVNASNFDKKQLANELIDSEKQIKVELWQYDPTLFTTDKIADPISVALSLSNEPDERVEMAVEEILDDLWEKSEW